MANFEARKVLMKDAQGRYVIPFTGAVETVNGQKPDENGNVVIEGVDTTTLLTKAVAAETYLSKTDAADTFLNKTDAASTYLTPAQANAAYLGIGDKAVSAETADNAVSATMASKAISDANGNAIATTYLPLGGGTMTGRLQLSNGENARIQSAVDTSHSPLLGGSAWNNGARIDPYGKDHATKPGWFQVVASNGTSEKYLTGRPDGDLSWDGKAVTLAGDCLPLSGGTMVGSIQKNGGYLIENTARGGALFFANDPSHNYTNFGVYGPDNATNPGAYVVKASDGTSTNYFLLHPDGRMLWVGKNVVRSVNGLVADKSGNVALPLCPDYSTKVSTTLTTSGFVAPYDCFVYVWNKQAWTAGSIFYLVVNGVTISLVKVFSSTTSQHTLSITGFIRKGDTVKAKVEGSAIQANLEYYKF